MQGRLRDRVASIQHRDLATLVYTSGTTGMPKGCVLTHYNFAWAVSQLDGSISDLVGETNRTLMFLPLAHIFARAVQAVAVSTGSTIGFSTGIPNLLEELPMFRPTFVFSVPRVFEKVYNGAKQKADSEGKGKIFNRSVSVAIAYSQGVQRGKIRIGTKLMHSVFDKLVYSKIRALFGGNVNYAISGGAPLGARLGHFFRGAGVVILEGYGLTETTAGATLNRPDAIKVGTVGRPIQGASIRIADDGEVLIKGGQVYSGYWDNEAATHDALTDDGWFHSGDIGVLDDEGFLSITGRKKEIIVTAAGKNVAPAILEDRTRSNPLVSQVMVVGDAKPFIAALVTLDADALAPWASARGLDDAPLSELATNDEVIAEVRRGSESRRLRKQGRVKGRSDQDLPCATSRPLDRGRRAHADTQGQTVCGRLEVCGSNRRDIRINRRPDIRINRRPAAVDSSSASRTLVRRRNADWPMLPTAHEPRIHS